MKSSMQDRCSAGDIVRGLNLLLGLPNFKPQQADALRQALLAYAQGLDCADSPTVKGLDPRSLRDQALMALRA